MNPEFEKYKRNYSWVTLSIIAVILAYFTYSGRWIGNDKAAWKGIIQDDARGYYAYLPAVLIFHDLHFDFIKEEGAKVYGKGGAGYLYLVNGERGNKYFIGVSIMLLPFFLLASLVSHLLGFEVNGYNAVYFGSVSVASWFYLLFTLVLLGKILRTYKVREVWIHSIWLLIVFGTNLFYYSVFQPGMSHVYSIFTITAFIYCLRKYGLQKDNSLLFKAALALALTTLIRPVNVIVLLAVPFLVGSPSAWSELVRGITAKGKIFFGLVLVYLVIVFLQPLVLYLTYGDFFRWPYSGEKFEFLHPHFWDTLFSYRKGLFVYTPFMILSIVFILWQARKNRFAAGSFLLFFIALNYVISSWGTWDYGGSYGLRAFIEFYPVFIIPIATGLNGLVRKWHRALAGVFLSLLLVVSIIQTYQYCVQIISYTDMDKEKYWKVFLRTDKDYKRFVTKINVYELDESRIVKRETIVNDFEGGKDWGYPHTITSEDYFSAGHSVKINKAAQFSPGLNMPFSELIDKNVDYVRVNLMAKTLDKNCEALLVISLELEDQEIFRYDQYPIALAEGNPGEWKKVSYGSHIPILTTGGLMRVYVWCQSESPLFIDDIQVELITLREDEKGQPPK